MLLYREHIRFRFSCDVCGVNIFSVYFLQESHHLGKRCKDTTNF